MTAQDTFLPDTEKKYRAVWISDIHLGTPGCQAGHLLDFLRSFDSDYLYLVGDIIDGWQLKRSWYWQQSHNDVIQKVLRKARKGTHVIFIPGNHDEAVRQFIGMKFGDIQIMEEAIHETADGRRLWITHGDLFDGVIQCARWLAHLGDQAYEFTLKLNRWFNYLRARLGLPYWSLSRFLKHKVKRAVSFISDFEQAVAHEARRRGLDGVVCGHIHHAEMREIEGVLYCNDGDWVESLTALVEHEDGRLEIIDWSQHIRQRRAHTATAAATAAAPVPLPLPEPVTAESQS
ncbi:MAG: UDP-2,3-diacylglucosamine diphosphatase [Burkholderiales bacterium]|jgi:UDP-2,3-diacylglucosamine pyrophosphatase LpxH|nr:UDP-2,3-diacylglucosamine diphosphatase [Burkholderiales bacterium]MCA3153727.1 UDP-2,3-diacylglucosamine diphosphatase [Burkholderiales bacterium]MCA3156092.1 UDP-2,3-diacylglucosamine diphosphatase [Burkholderiales bacterium]MCA3158947.1 UDP-2,3-diacylglucosamine diphosphatase [Burkholderiales bacterium]MCA3160837.1 UDP-2,3-diacylglucosamine diphosphatase [Burkholderiales bacterium]